MSMACRGGIRNLVGLKRRVEWGRKYKWGQKPGTNYGGLCRMSKEVNGHQVLFLSQSLCWACCLTVLSHHTLGRRHDRNRQREWAAHLAPYCPVVFTLFAPFPQKNLKTVPSHTWKFVFFIFNINKLILIKIRKYWTVCEWYTQQNQNQYFMKQFDEISLNYLCEYQTH